MNPAAPAAGTVLCRLDEIEQARGFRFRTDEAVFYGMVLREGEAVRGFIDSCPHTGQPLSLFGDRYFTRDGRFLLCSGHGAMFEPKDGACIAGPCVGRALRPWPVAVSDGAVVVA
ncbi:MAG TPA: Rieske (2Fe-2S) protein [Caulobacteraceae bacterium]